jgi:asparaginyl-tRNA synthetase
MKLKIRELKKHPEKHLGQDVTVNGWVRSVRDQKSFSFIDLNDGSTLSGLQVLLKADRPGYSELLPKLQIGASLSVKGKLVQSPGEKQAIEVDADEIKVIGLSDAESYPLQKKRHSFEYLRTIAHLRPRTNTIGAVARMSSSLAFATHHFFQSRGFLNIHTPIITASDCEGAGELFRVTTLDVEKPPRTKEGEVDFSKDFFEKPAFLTVSGQLNAEIYAMACSDVYTFGPTFRAENSNTTRHLAEFWMIEPEMAFATLEDDMELAESYLRHVIQYVLEHNEEDIDFFDKLISPGLKERLLGVVHSSFERVTYSDAIILLENVDRKWEFPVKWGIDLQTEHERYLTEEHFKKPVILINYPKEIKAFYMRLNEDGKTVAAMDVLVPGIGEIIGGSQREERMEVLEEKILKAGLHKEDYWWYLELRKWGSCPHAGFGCGFERLVRFTTGMENIRDCIPFPRTPGNALF